MRSSDDDVRPSHCKLVKNRWYWDPPDRLRKSHALKTVALGADQAAAWAYARRLNRDHLGLGPGQPVVGSVAWMLKSFLSSAKFEVLKAPTQKDYRWIARKLLMPTQVGPRILGVSSDGGQGAPRRHDL